MNTAASKLIMPDDKEVKNFTIGQRVDELSKKNINLVPSMIITDSNGIITLINNLEGKATKAISLKEKNVIKAQIITLNNILQKQIEMTANLYGADLVVSEDVQSDPKLNFVEGNKNETVAGPQLLSESPEIKEQIETGQLIEASEKFKLAAQTAETLKVDQFIKGYNRQVIVGTSLQKSLPPKISELIKNADTEGKVDEICSLLIKEGFAEKALNISLDIFITRLGHKNAPKKTRKEVELRFINEILPMVHKCPVEAMVDVNERNLGQWEDYILEVLDIYETKDKIINSAVVDLNKQKFIAKETSKFLKAVQKEETIYNEIMGMIGLASNVPIADIKFEDEIEIEDAVIITDEIAPELKEAIVSEAEAKAIFEPNKEEIEKGLLEIISKGIVDKSVNIGNACKSFFKTSKAYKLFEKGFNLEKWTKEKKEELAKTIVPKLDQEKREMDIAASAEIKKLEDTSSIGDNTIVSKEIDEKGTVTYESDKTTTIIGCNFTKQEIKPNFFKAVAIADIEKIDPSVVETVKMVKDLPAMTTFLQQVLYDIPRGEKATIPVKQSYNIAASLATEFVKNISECKDWTDMQIKEWFKGDVYTEGLKVRPELEAEKLAKRNAKSEVIFDNRTPKAIPEVTGEHIQEVKSEITTDVAVYTSTTSPLKTATEELAKISELKFKDLPEPIQKEFGSILNANRKEFNKLSEEFLVKNHTGDIKETAKILANIWHETAERKSVHRFEERMNGVNKIIRNSPKLAELVKV
jgi:hypothetical protein